jgi:hypothetical protein
VRLTAQRLTGAALVVDDEIVHLGIRAVDMSLASLRQEPQSRGGEAPMWLVFLHDAVAQVQRESGSLLLQRAFWTRGEALPTRNACTVSVLGSTCPCSG